jgi:hypothetical protein
MYRGFLTPLGLEAERPKRVSELAGKLRPELKEEFDPLFKVCSKIMHRTSFSIASIVMQGSLDELLPFLANGAFSDVLSIYAAIKGYVDRNGIRPPDQSS